MKRKKLSLLLLLFLCVFVFPCKTFAASKVKGIDVSVNNGNVNWEAIKNQGYTYVMLKTGDGKEPENFEDDVDAKFEENYEGARAAGLKVGVYHVCCCRTVSEAKKEAAYCLKILNGRKLDYPVAYDMEMPGNFARGKTNTTAMAKAFTDKIRKAGYTPMIYSSASYLDTYFNWKKLSDVYVWVAHYDVKKPAFKRTYHMWQYSNEGSLGGISSDVDLNYSYLEKPKKVKLKKKSITLKVKQTYKIKATIYPETVHNKLKYTSDRKSVAKVNNKGIVTARKKGKAVITIHTVNKRRVKLSVRVK